LVAQVGATSDIIWDRGAPDPQSLLVFSHPANPCSVSILSLDVPPHLNCSISTIITSDPTDERSDDEDNDEEPVEKKD
jgi:hypothetical protein